jgi:hypothetical protein
VTAPTLNRELIAVMFLRSFKRNELVTESIEFSNHAPILKASPIAVLLSDASKVPAMASST